MPCKLKIVQISFGLTCAHRLVHEQPPRLDRKPLHQRHHQAPYWDRLTWYRFRLCPLSSTSTPSRSTTPTFPEVPTTCSSMQAGLNLASCVYMYMYLHACIAQIQEDACVYYDKIQHCADVWEGVQIRSGNNSRRSRPQRHHGSDASATTTTTPRARPTASSHKQAIRITSTTSRAASSSSDHVDRDHVDHVPSSSAELRPPRPQDYVAMMIAAKNGATTITTTVMTTGRKARGPDNFIANDTSSHLSNIATHRLHPPVVNKAKYYF